MDNSSLDLMRAERQLKRSLDCDVSKEELDFFNGNLTKEDIKRLLVRLKNLQRNIEVKGQDLKETMCEPTLLDVLAKKVNNLLMKLQAYGRIRRPKVRKKEVTTKSSTWTLPIHKRAELFKKYYVEEEHKGFHIGGGQLNLINSPKKKHFKEDLKPP